MTPEETSAFHPASLLQALPEEVLQSLGGAAGGPWEVGGGLQSGSQQKPCGSLDLSYHGAHGTVTGSLSTQGRGLETGLGYQGKVGNHGRLEGTFSTNGHDWNAHLSYHHRF